MKQPTLEGFNVNVRFKLSALWASVTLYYLYGDYFELYVPGKTERLVNGINLLNSPLILFAASVLLSIPAVMVFLSMILELVLNKRLNIILGIFMLSFIGFLLAMDLPTEKYNALD